MLKFVTGDFFDYKADIRINTVNCVGVMGTGVALAFKNKFPKMYKEYRSLCKRQKIDPSHPHVWREKDLIIINLPTKIDWRNPSEYSYIEENLVWLRNYLLKKEDLVITLPALGCGHGKLSWKKVKEMIEDYLDDLSVEILVFPPSSSKRISSHTYKELY